MIHTFRSTIVTIRRSFSSHRHSFPFFFTYCKGLSINVSVGGGGGSPKDDLLNRPYLIKKGGVSKIVDFEMT